VAGLGLFELHDFRALWKIRRSEFWLGTATVASVLVLGMSGGIAFAIGLSLIVALVRLVRPHTAELGQVEGTDTFCDIDRNDDAIFLEVDDVVEYYLAADRDTPGS
jgi:MFS superfamily sulfate permease-like transporter